MLDDMLGCGLWVWRSCSGSRAGLGKPQCKGNEREGKGRGGRALSVRVCYMMRVKGKGRGLNYCCLPGVKGKREERGIWLVSWLTGWLAGWLVVVPDECEGKEDYEG